MNETVIEQIKSVIKDMLNLFLKIESEFRTNFLNQEKINDDLFDRVQDLENRLDARMKTLE